MNVRAASLPIVPLLWPAEATLFVPGSKSEANRLLVAAAMSGERVLVRGATACHDVRYLVQGLAAMGFLAFFVDESEGRLPGGDLHPVGELEGPDLGVAVERGAGALLPVGRETDRDGVAHPLDVRRDVGEVGPHHVGCGIELGGHTESGHGGCLHP